MSATEKRASFATLLVHWNNTIPKISKNFTPKLIMAIVTRFIAGETRNVIDFKNF